MKRIRTFVAAAILTLGLSACAMGDGAFTSEASSVTTATPVAAYLGAGGVLSGVELGVLRGFVNSNVFSVEVTVTESDGTPHGTKTFSLAEASVFGSSGSQANVGVNWNGNQAINADHFLDVCATVVMKQQDGTTVFSDEVCSTLDPQ